MHPIGAQTLATLEYLFRGKYADKSVAHREDVIKGTQKITNSCSGEGLVEVNLSGNQKGFLPHTED